jgi:hypothetical protein
MTTSSWECYLSLSNHVAKSCLSSPLTGNLSVFYVCQLPLISHHGSWVCHHQVLLSFVFYNRRNIACQLDLMLSSLCTNTDYSLSSKNHLSHFRLFCQLSMRMRNVYIHVCNVQCLKHCLKQKKSWSANLSYFKCESNCKLMACIYKDHASLYYNCPFLV